MFLLPASGSATALLAVVILIGLALRLRPKQYRREQWQQPGIDREAKDGKQDTIEHMLPLDTFDLDATAPERIRPFLSKIVYNLTMAIQACNPGELLVFDRNYISRLRIREATMRNHAHDVLAASKHSGVKAAVDELYEGLVQDYLPKRYPTIFKLCTADGEQAAAIKATHLKVIPDANRLVPLTASPLPVETLQTLGNLLDDDFVLLFPSTSPTSPANVSYTAQAYIFCCPSGFSPRTAIFGKPLAAIHAPVPGYTAKLEKSMDRFFARLETGRVVKRANWSIVMDDQLYKPLGNHSYAADEGDGEAVRKEAQEAEAVDAESCYLRVERQTLRRLPRSRAVVFSLKTYLTPLAEVKAEGNGVELADAIEGLHRGNVPEIWRYKRAGVWGQRACEFLRG